MFQETRGCCRRQDNLGWLAQRDVGLVTDQKVLENVFKGEYVSWAAFKKAMYQERYWTSQLGLQTNHHRVEIPMCTPSKVTIRSYAEMQKLMDA